MLQVPGDTLGDEYKGYLFKITGGNDKQGVIGFLMSMFRELDHSWLVGRFPNEAGWYVLQ